MSELTATYTFEGEEIFAIHEGKVIASGTSMSAVEDTAVEYLDSLKKTRDGEAKEKTKKKATHIITPNGIKGEIIDRTPDIWGDTVTARFENGTFGTFQVHGSHDVQWITEAATKTASADTIGRLSSVLESDYERDRDSLATRHDALLALTREAHTLIESGAPYATEVKLDEIRTAAEHERRQVKEAIDHLDAADAETFIPNAPFRPSVAEQADLGHGSDWLDVTTREMIAESEGQDFDKMLSEGPAVFVTELDGGALGDAGVTREMAFSHIMAKTAGFEGEEVEDFREKFVARTEVARRHELAQRKETNHKEAAAVQETQESMPDEVLFMN